jgi:hypothetical protein
MFRNMPWKKPLPPNIMAACLALPCLANLTTFLGGMGPFHHSTLDVIWDM